jgi:RNA polymerase sigma factor FliA
MTTSKSTSKGSSVKPAPEISKYEAEIGQWQHLVWYVVNRIKPRLPASVAEDDLFAAGMFGLMRAARSYDPSRGAGFKTYAYHRIRGAILDDLRRSDFLPRSMRDKARAEGVEPPSLLGIPTDEDGHENLAAHPVGESAANEDMHDLLQEAIDNLPEKMRIVMSLYYREEVKMREIGERLKLTESRVSQIHSNAVTRLRRAMRSANGES